MLTTRWPTLLIAVALGLSGCASASSGGATGSGATSVARTSSSAPPGSSAPPTSSAAASSSAPPSASAASVTSNPCDVLTRDEASALSGVSMPSGVRQPWGTGAVKCGYHSGPIEAFVILAKAASPAQARSAWNAEKADLQKQAAPAGVTVTSRSVPGLGDQAELFVGSVTVNGIKNSMMAIFVLKGDTFLDLGDFALMGGRPATTAALTAQAETSAARV